MSSHKGSFTRSFAGTTGKVVGVVLTGLIVLSGQGAAFGDVTDPSADPSATSTTATDVRNDYIVTFAADTTEAVQQDDLAAADAVTNDSVAPLHLYSVALTDAGVTTLRANPDVLGVETDKVREVQAAPSDPSYDGQWALPKIGWDAAYGSVGVTGSATVAVLDTGVNATDDLGGKLVDGASMLDGITGTDDPNGHGTAMASIVAAGTDNATGIAGVGYQGVSVMPVKVLGADGTGQDSDIVRGVVYAADHGADVILMSFANPGRSAALQSAADYAWSKGAVLVAATGNDGSTVDTFPAGLSKVVGVSATTQDDALWTGSNSGADTFLGAPGVDIESGSGALTGTSASAAIVAGAAALVKAHDPSATNGVVVGRLARDADPAGSVSDTGNGRVDLARALGDTSTDAVVPQGVAGNGGPIVGPYVAATNATIVGTVTSSATGNPIAGATVSCSNNCNNGTGPTTTSATGTYSLPVSYSGNDTITITVQASGFTSKSQMITPGNGSPGTKTLDFSLTPSAPTCTAAAVATSPSSTTVTYGNDATFTASATGTPTPTVQWQVNTGSGFSNITGAQSTTLTLTAPAVSANGNQYRAVFTNTCGGTQTATSSPAALTVNKKPLTISGAVANSRPYDATSTATVDFTGASLSGVVAGDTVAIDSSSYTASFLNKTVATGKAVTVNGVALGGASAANYSVAQPTGLTANITPANVTVSGITAADKQYDGGTSATLNTDGAALVGKFSGDALSLVTSGAVGAFGDADAGTSKTVQVSGLTITGGDALNYTLTQPTTTANITQKNLTVSGALAQSRPYDGTKAANVDFSGASLQGVVNSDPVTLVTSGYAAEFADKTVGTNKAVTVTGVTLGGTAAGNYTVSQPTGLSADITAMELTVTGITAANKVYDGNRSATLDTSHATLVGKQGTDAVTLDVTGAAGQFGTANVGTGKSVQISGLTISGTDKDNYTLTQPSTTADITQAVLTVTPENAVKTYGDTDPAATYHLSGFVNSENATSADVSGTPSCSIGPHAANAGTYHGVVTCAVGSLTAANYSFVAGAPADLVIHQAVLSVDADAKNKTYGQSDPELTASLSGFVNHDTADNTTVSGAPSCTRESGQEAGSYTITCEPGTLATDNYSFATGDTAKLTIGQAVLTVVPEAASKTYGRDDPAPAYHLNGFQFSDDAASATSGAAACSIATHDQAAGTYTDAVTCTAGNLEAANYTFAVGDPADLVINKAELTVVPEGAEKTYGQDDPPAAYHLSGFQYSDDALSATSGAAACSIATHSENAGIYPSAVTCTAGNLDSPNYTFAIGNVADLVIDKAVLTVVPHQASKTYGQADPDPTYTLSGFQYSDDAESATSGAAACAIAMHSDNAGTYPGAVTCTVHTLDAANYTFAVGDPADLVIDKAQLTVVPEGAEKTYGQDDPPAAYHLSGFRYSDDAASATSGAAACAIAMHSENAGTYPGAVTCTVHTLDAANYTFTVGVPAALVIDQAVLTVVPNQASKTYGQSDPAATSHLSGFVYSEDATSAGVTGAATCSIGSHSQNAGTYTGVVTCTVGNLGAANYSFTSGAAADLVIGKAPLELKADPLSKVYGDNNPALTFSAVGLVNSDTTSTALTSNPTLSTAANNTSGIGTYAITITGGTSDNYNLSRTNGVLTVTRATLTVIADSFTKSLHAPNPTFTGTVTGIKNNDPISVTYSTTAGTATDVGSYAITPIVTAMPASVLDNYTLVTTNGYLQIFFVWNGFLQPINDTAHQVGLFESKFKLGQTIPVKFDLMDANGAIVQQTGNAPTFKRSDYLGDCDPMVSTETSTAVSPDGAAVYTYTSGHYQYNWSTKGLTKPGEYRIYATLADGSPPESVFICLTK